MEVSNPWRDAIKVVYWAKNMHKSKYFKGIMGCVSDTVVSKDEHGRPLLWDWCIEIFLGTIWQEAEGNFERFADLLFKTWLEEWLHMIYRWERVHSLNKEDFEFRDEEKPVRAWVKVLTNLP